LNRDKPSKEAQQSGGELKRDLNHQNLVVHLSDAVADGKTDTPTEPESVLGHRLLPTYAGVLRSGIKVPYESGKNALTAKERTLYEKWTSEGRSPREIEKEIKKDLRPTNVPYFSVYRSECKNNPEHAELIRALYANERGEIYRLRITFLSEKWWETIPHKLMAFRKSGLYCSSEPIGGRLIATRDPELDPEAMKQDGTLHVKEKRRREFLRKKMTLHCIPDECPIYAANGCRFSGVLHFMILGVPGTDVWRLSTTSWYSVRGIKEKIDMFQSALAARGRSIVGIPFELFKYEAEISRWDPEKGRIRSKQWVIRIDCPELPLADLIVQSAGFESVQRPQALLPVNGIHGSGASATTGRLPEGRKAAEVPRPGTAASVLPPDLPGWEDQSRNEELKPSPRFQRKDEEERDNSESAHCPETGVASVEKMTREELQSAIQGEVQPIGEAPMETVQAYLRSVGKNQFKELSMEEAAALYKKILMVRDQERPAEDKEEKKEANRLATGTPETGAKEAGVCSACRAEIPGEIEQYSLKRFRRPLCRNCQDKEKGSLPSRTTPSRKVPGQVPDAKF
jgi:hypothetical protein